jgi:hypothetical protein
LLIICAIGGCANARVRAKSNRPLGFLTFLPAAAMFLFGVFEPGGHYVHMQTAAQYLYHSGHPTRFQTLDSLYNDPPLAEFVLIILGAADRASAQSAHECPYRCYRRAAQSGAREVNDRLPALRAQQCD